MVAKKIKSKNRHNFIDGKDLDEVSQKEINIPVDVDDSIESMFRNEMNNNQNDVKELFHEDKVKARSDISIRQVKLITKGFYLAKLTGQKEVIGLLNDFLTLSISKDRKSRAEYVQALQQKMQNEIMNGQNIRGQFGK